MRLFSFTSDENGYFGGKLLAISFIPSIPYLAFCIPLFLPRKRLYRNFASDAYHYGWTILEFSARFSMSHFRPKASFRFDWRPAGKSVVVFNGPEERSFSPHLKQFLQGLT